MPKIDLHVHSHYSDGTHSPSEVVELAHQKGVVALALTDHDTLDGIPETVAAGQTLGIDIVAGIELSTIHHNQEIHLLAYGFDWQNPSLIHQITTLQASRNIRNSEAVTRLNELGLSLTYDEVKTIAGKGTVGRPHIAQVLLEKGYVNTFQEAFTQYLGEKAPAYIPRDLPSTTQAIEWIRQAGGVTSLAHPNWIKQKGKAFLTFCKELQEAGLHALEVFYSTHTPRQISFFLQCTRQLDLLVTGGSDFHGTHRPDIAIGVGRGNLKVPMTLLEPLRQAMKN
jgi:predicted metal-dependent phosphoesterase TrpH